MYKTHQPRIQKYALASSDNAARVVSMVSLSIQQAWYSVGNQLADVDANGENSRFLWGSKKPCYNYVTKHKGDLFLALHEYKKGKIDLPDLLVKVADIPGLGLVKAGFVIQLSLGKIGCLDVHNLRQYGVDAAMFKYGKNATPATKRKKAELYIATCEKLGGSEYLWNKWCESLAANPRCRDRFTSKHHVSRMHCEFLGV